jgi:hypothetical protein
LVFGICSFGLSTFIINGKSKLWLLGGGTTGSQQQAEFCAHVSQATGGDVGVGVGLGVGVGSGGLGVGVGFILGVGVGVSRTTVGVGVTPGLTKVAVGVGVNPGLTKVAVGVGVGVDVGVGVTQPGQFNLNVHSLPGKGESTVIIADEGELNNLLKEICPAPLLLTTGNGKELL